MARGPGELESFTSKGLPVRGAPRMIFVWCVHFPWSCESPMSVEIDYLRVITLHVQTYEHSYVLVCLYVSVSTWV